MVRGKRLAVLAGGLGGLVAAALVLVVGLVAAVVFLGGGSDEAPTASADENCGGSSPAVPVLDPGPRVATLTAEQTGNARTIVQVASSQSASQGLGRDRTRQAAVPTGPGTRRRGLQLPRQPAAPRHRRDDPGL